MIDLDKPLNDFEADRLRNQILALKNVIVQFGGGGLFDRVVVSANERLLRHLERRFDSWLNFRMTVLKR